MGGNGALRIELAGPTGAGLRFGDLGPEFLEANGWIGREEEKFEAFGEEALSKSGNPYYSWEASHMPLPDGFATRIVVNGVYLGLGTIETSKKGNPMRCDKGETRVTAETYLASAVLVRTRRGFWIKVHAHRKPGRRG